MNIKEMQDEIMRIKKEKDICILAHAYQSHDIWEVADYVGDSFGLAQRAAEAPQKTMIMCGVRFMAETVKLLSPEKTVYLPEPDAGCPMADQIDYDLLAALREKNPDYTVVAYVMLPASSVPVKLPASIRMIRLTHSIKKHRPLTTPCQML